MLHVHRTSDKVIKSETRWASDERLQSLSTVNTLITAALGAIV